MAALVRMKEKFQLTVPVALRERARFSVGDLYEADVSEDGGTLTFKAKSLVDRSVEVSRADYAAGRYRGPFSSVEEERESLGVSVIKKRRRGR